MTLLSCRTLALAGALLLALAGCQAPSDSRAGREQAQAAAAHAALVEIFVAGTQPEPGRSVLQVPDGVLYIERRPVLGREDLSEAAALQGEDGQAYLGLRFTEEGAARLAAVSRARVGSLLALVIDRELITAPEIAEPLDRGVLALAMPDAAMASELAARIRGAGPRDAPLGH
ncbi:preprotein translocase subunit SecD [Orrella sp. JC864]|uniref:SecDF P1 head subdomain-containing protein n=1 Tax=Orrella sp. JC864 TaxID=3120298 RepID=UPI003008FFDC